jgi:hypothetical protein
LAPRALSPKWTPLHLPCASWLAVYIGLCYQLGLRPRLPIHRRPLSSGVYSLFSRTHASSHERTTIATPPCPRPHWTEPVSREETLARREKFQKIGWLPPNHKPKTKKVIATAKRLWDKYVIRGCHLCLQHGVTVRTANGVAAAVRPLLSSPCAKPISATARFSSNHSSLIDSICRQQHQTSICSYFRTF